MHQLDVSPHSPTTLKSVSNAELLSTRNVPTENPNYQPDVRGKVATQKEIEQKLEALSEFNIVRKSTNGRPQCTTKQALSCASLFMRDHLSRFAVSEMENHVILATLCDSFSPDTNHCNEIVKYVLSADDGSNGLEVAKYMLKRLKEGNSIIAAKVLLLTHRLITIADVRFIGPLHQLQKEGDNAFQSSISAICHERTSGGPNSDGGAALPLLEVYFAYLHAIGFHIVNMTKILGTNIYKEKLHNNEYLTRMDMDAAIADLVKQSTEVLMIISAFPVIKELFQLEITRLLFESLIIDAHCLYAFDSKALDNAFIQRKGTRTRVGLLKWLRVFQAFENTGHALNAFFSKIGGLRVALPVQIPKFFVHPEGTAQKIRESLKDLLSSSGGEIDECVIDSCLADAQEKAGVVSPASVCQMRRKEKERGLSLTGTASSSPTKGALTDSQGAGDVSNDSTVSSNATNSADRRVITGFKMPKDREEYTLQRDVSTMMSVPNTLDSTFDTMNTMDIQMTNTDPLADTKDSKMIPSQFVDEAQGSRFVIFSEDVLGKGSFGIVYKAWDEEEGRHVACKQIARRKTSAFQLSDTAGEVASLKSEFEVLTSLQHENIVSVFAFQSQPTFSRIFMEWVPGGSVQDIFKRSGKGLSMPVIRKYLTGALKGLAYMHERMIVHRDIKPGNMLVDAAGNIKLTDFGTSTLLRTVGADAATPSDLGSTSSTSPPQTTIVGTIPYLAPESVQGCYSVQSDIWSLGASAVHMYTGRVPWCEKKFLDAFQLLYHIGSAKEPNHKMSFTADVPNLPPPTGDFLDFLNACLPFDKDVRPSAHQLLSHPFIINEIRAPLV